MSLLKDSMTEELNKFPDIGFNIDDICKESAIVADVIEKSMLVLEVMEKEKDTMTYETALAYALPLYGYDKEALVSDVNKVESMTFENAEDNENAKKGAAKVLTVIAAISEAIKKAFRIFYVLFKKAQQKIILWLNNVKPFIEKLKASIKNTDFTKGSDFDEGDKKSIANLIGVYSMFTGSINDNTMASIITSFKNIKDFKTTLKTYTEYMESTKSILLSNDESKIKDISTEEVINNSFFKKLPKFYAKISDLVESNKSSGLIKIDNIPFKHISVVGTDGKNLLGLYSDARAITVLKVFHGNVIVDKVVSNIDLKPIDKAKLEMLISAIESVDIKSISDELRQEFANMESKMNSFFTAFNAFKNKELNGDFMLGSNMLKVIFSENVSAMNKLSFDYINYNAKLMVNALKFAKLNLDKYTKSESKEDDKVAIENKK